LFDLPALAFIFPEADPLVLSPAPAEPWAAALSGG
jgi:hypothetical protein